jgi:hypothetical protein
VDGSSGQRSYTVGDRDERCLVAAEGDFRSLTTLCSNQMFCTCGVRIEFSRELALIISEGPWISY